VWRWCPRGMAAGLEHSQAAGTRGAAAGLEIIHFRDESQGGHHGTLRPWDGSSLISLLCHISDWPFFAGMVTDYLLHGKACIRAIPDSLDAL
jgi:hypothetical protein